MVIRKYGSMVNTLQGSNFKGSREASVEALLEKRDKSMPDERQETLGMEDDHIANTQQTTVQETTDYQGQKFDLIGFSDYFPFGLK